ncbi:MAG: ABC transporter ATP-binding protein [Alphaproteobacteria bacterium]|nr:MAG: ABC transporter ATP-binding protein [Alphaproteobacteria bacterium]
MNDQMEKNLFRYVWRHSRPQQIWILVIVALSMPTYFLAFDIPKLIVNGPILGQGFDTVGATQKVLPITIGNPFGDQSFTLFAGFDLERIGALVALSLAFLGYVIINGLFKVYINTYKGRLGERMLRRLRYQLVDRVLRFPIAHYRRVRSSEIATMIKDEVEPLGGFIGEAFAQPAFLVGQAGAALLFIMLQSWMLGSVALAILVIQAALIPKLRGRLRQLALQRQLTARDLSGRVSETVDGALDIRLNDSSNYERSDISARLAKLFFIRFDFYKRKFLIKFINNFLAQFTPFVFYLGGGFLAIRGDLDIGQLVAVIAAYKDLPGPIKELIDWDYQRLDVQVKYTQVINQFDVSPLAPEESQAVQTDDIPSLTGPITFRQVSALDDSGNTLLNDLNLTIGLDERIAVIGATGGGAEIVADMIVRLVAPSSGTLNIGAAALASLPEWQTGRRFGYAGAEPFFAHGTARDALLSGLRHAPMKPAREGMEMTAAEMREAGASGNPTLDLQADWIDYAAAGVDDHAELATRITTVLQLTGLEDDIYAFGLRSKLSDAANDTSGDMILEARKIFLDRLAKGENASDVDPFVAAKFNTHLTLLQNLVFGSVSAPEFLSEDFSADSPLWAILAADGLDKRFYQIGQNAAAIIVDLFQEVSDNMQILERLDLIHPDDLSEFEAALRRIEGLDFSETAPEDRQKFMHVAFSYCEPRHRLGLINDDLCVAVVASRQEFRARLPEQLASAFAFHDPDVINPDVSLQDNILFGRIADERSGAGDRVSALLHQILEELDLSNMVIERGLNYDIGTGGRRLSLSQRQQLGLARVLLKRPQFLIVNRGLSALDARTVEKVIERILAVSKSRTDGFGTLWVTATESHSAMFERVLNFSRGELVSDEVKT